jgi:hypothetical protein
MTERTRGLHREPESLVLARVLNAQVPSPGHGNWVCSPKHGTAAADPGGTFVPAVRLSKIPPARALPGDAHGNAGPYRPSKSRSRSLSVMA